MYIEWQRVTTSDTTSDNEWLRVTSSDNEWQMSDNEWERVVQRMTKSDNMWCISANFSFFFQIKEEPTTKHPKENTLNIEEDLWRRPIKLRAETSP